MTADSLGQGPQSQDSGSGQRMNESAAAFEFSFLTDEPASASTTDTDQSAASDQAVTHRRRRMSPQHIRRILASYAQRARVQREPVTPALMGFVGLNRGRHAVSMRCDGPFRCGDGCFFISHGVRYSTIRDALLYWWR